MKFKRDTLNSFFLADESTIVANESKKHTTRELLASKMNMKYGQEANLFTELTLIDLIIPLPWNLVGEKNITVWFFFVLNGKGNRVSFHCKKLDFA